ncbi:unnamed protein product [Phytophthora lilii]|uniref:Unnamed protein product n=1 Tax=Phytophthora lilii TaxID=2077276 RepID=A0A9W7CRN1_9STRA|nr:unnamed protein product [Phytophthora lilii]
MSSASDISAFEHSYAGQIQFNLSVISSQAAFVNWEEAVIELPVKLQILNGGAGSVTSTAACTIDQLVPKAGAWQFINSVQVVIDGTTVQTNQVHENVNTTFKAITETDYNTYVKHGPTSNFVLDEYAAPTIQGSSGAAQSLDNMATSSFMAATNNVGEFGLANTYSNRGAAERSLFTALDHQSTKLAFDVMGGSANLQTVSKPQVYVAPAGAVAAGSPFYVAHYLACIKLRDISDYFKKCRMQKNTRGFIYLTYNSSSTTLVTTDVIAPATIASLSNNMNFGNTCPVLWNLSSGVTTTALAGGLALPASAVTLTITADVNGTPTGGTGITPSQSFSRLLVPTYSPNPSADHALAQKKTFRYFERITNKFTVAPGASFTWTVSNGIANLKRLICNLSLPIQPQVLLKKHLIAIYNAMAKSDFVQGKKLKALIQRKSLDDASIDSLANLFQQVMGKNREYEYDQLKNKLLKSPKGPPEIIKYEAKETPKSSKKKHTYVPQSNDADANMEEPSASEESSEDFYGRINDVT